MQAPIGSILQFSGAMISAMKRKKKIWIWIIVLVIAAAVMFCIYLKHRPQPSKDLKEITLEVVDDQGEIREYSAETNAEYLSGLMDELKQTGDFTYEAEESSFGLYINSVNGLTADFSQDNAYWAIYINDEYGQYAADLQVINDGDVIKLMYEK